MKEEHVFLISLDEFCAKWNYDDKRKQTFKNLLSETDALVDDEGIDCISLNLYMNYTLKGLEFVKVETHNAPTLKNILDYDSVCRIYLEEWIHLSSEIQRAYSARPAYIHETDFMENMSDLTSAVKKVVEYFLDAQDILLNQPPPSQDSANNEAQSQS